MMPRMMSISPDTHIIIKYGLTLDRSPVFGMSSVFGGGGVGL